MFFFPPEGGRRGGLTPSRRLLCERWGAGRLVGLGSRWEELVLGTRSIRKDHRSYRRCNPRGLQEGPLSDES